MDRGVCVVTLLALLCVVIPSSYSKVALTARAKTRDAVLSQCGDDIWCQKFCPYLHHLFESSLTETMACTLGMEQDVNCNQQYICATWCPYINVQIDVPEKPKEWDICLNGSMPDGCENDKTCAPVCRAIHEDYENAPVSLQGCITGGKMLVTCEDKSFCEEVCSASRAASLKTRPAFLRHCAFSGHP